MKRYEFSLVKFLLYGLLFYYVLFLIFLFVEILYSPNTGLVDWIIWLVLACIPLAFRLGYVLNKRREEAKAEGKSPAVPADVKMAVFLEASIVATLLDRLGSENYIQEKVLPPDLEVTTRRELLDSLSSLGLREELDPWLLDLLLAPDGHWTADQRRRAQFLWEFFQTLLWIMGRRKMDPLISEPRYNFNDVQELLAIRRSSKLRFVAPWDVRIVRDECGYFVERSWSELIARNAISGLTDEESQHSLELSQQAQECLRTEDCLIADYNIAYWNTSVLTKTHCRAQLRWDALSVLVEVLGGDLPSSRLRDFLATYFVPQEVDEKIID